MSTSRQLSSKANRANIASQTNPGAPLGLTNVLTPLARSIVGGITGLFGIEIIKLSGAGLSCQMEEFNNVGNAL